MQQLSNISMQCLQRITIAFHVRTSCTYGISSGPLDNPRGTRGSYYPPFTDKEIKAQKCWDILKGTQLGIEKDSNQVSLFENQHSLHSSLLGQALFVRMEGSHHPCIIKNTKKVFFLISLKVPTILTTITSTLLKSKHCSLQVLFFDESFPGSF